MKRSKNIKEGTEEKDRVLRMAIAVVVALFVVGVIVVALRMMNLRVNASEGEKKLAQFEKLDVQEIEEEIRELEKAEREADEEWQNRPASEKFSGSLIMGDSITEGLYVYELLDASLVIAEKGLGVSEPEGETLTGYLNQAIADNPRCLFLAFGMNDIVGESGDAEAFAADYKEVLDKLRKELPDTEIYVNSILPANEQKINEDDRYQDVPAYNESLKALCEKEKITFIDNSDLVSSENYEEDGLHQASAFYPQWLNRMAEVAEL